MTAADESCDRCGAAFLSREVPLCPACSIAEVFSFGSEEKNVLTAELLDGKYLPGEVLGEGGFGIVYRAEQIKPIRRPVAIKIIKPGMASPDILARFEAERQALALLNHPGIAKILDAGETNDGSPYFAMELVDGQSITAHCTEHHLPTNERLELFAKACDAIGHAHARGIIHRDLKPSNILVNSDGEVKVIDFGVAKATRHVLTEATLLTGLHQFIGTPAYVSPEQAETSGRDVDARSDVFSLGAVLYELLTGKPPFDTDELSELGLGELLQLLREKMPPPPSTTAGEIGALDHVVMRSIEKAPDQRYETASALAEDIRRYIGKQPVEAKPIGKPRGSHKILAAGVTLVLGAGLLATKLIPSAEALTTPEAVAAADRLLDEGDTEGAEELLQSDDPATNLEAAAMHYLRTGRNTEARRALLQSLEIQRQQHGNNSAETLPALELLGDLITGEYWVSRGTDGKYLLEAAEIARKELGDASPVTARCIARLAADRGYHLGVNEAILRLRAAIARAHLAAADAGSIKLLQDTLTESLRRKQVCIDTAARHYEAYENAKTPPEAVHFLRRSSYWLASTGDTEAGLQRLENALSLERETPNVPFDTMQRNRIAEAWVAWRSLDYDRAISVFEDAVEGHLLDKRLVSNSRAELLHNFYRIARDSGDSNRYWDFMDGFEDRNANAVWPSKPTRVLIPRGSRWAFAYEPTAPSVDWTTDGQLPSRGHAPFNDYSIPAGCRLPWPSKDSPATWYFRTSFSVDAPDEFDRLKVRLTRWTGAAVYLNGTEVARDNLSPTARHDTFAARPEQGGQLRPHVFVIDPTYLVSGENTLAVEIHRYGTGAHRYFDLQLEGRKSF